MADEVVLLNDLVADKIIDIRDRKVLLDIDVAELYQITTREVNQAISRNSEKFQNGYIIILNDAEKMELITNCDRFRSLKHASVLPKAFTEKALYLLATILKSPRATATTIAIIEAFANMREIKRTIIDAVKLAESGKEPKKMIEKVGKLVSNLIVPDDNDLRTIAIEDEAEFKFMGMLKLSRKVIKKSKATK